MAARLSIECIRLHLIEGRYGYALSAEYFGPKTGAHSSQLSGQEETQWEKFPMLSLANLPSASIYTSISCLPAATEVRAGGPIQNGIGSSASAGSGAQASTRWATTSPTTTIEGDPKPSAST